MHAALREAQPPLSRSVEDYLKVIYHLSSEGGFATTSDIASMLAVAPPSVSGMTKRLSEAGLIEHVPYRGVQLTHQGRRAALRMIRRHRVLEVYLNQKLGYDWDNVHQEAERLEHAVSDELIERMAEALGDPHYDPHGAPIPTVEGDIEETQLISLAEAPVGAALEVRQVDDGDPARLRYLAGLGLTPGTRISVTDRQPFNGPTVVQMGRDTRVVGQDLARSLLCREADAAAGGQEEASRER
jgi:DtxR family Mn-dependent transcriptional regulator